MGLKKLIAEKYRMDYNAFVRKVVEYMNRRGISHNGTIPKEALKRAYEEGMYPSKFVQEYVKSIDKDTRKGGYRKVEKNEE